MFSQHDFRIFGIKERFCHNCGIEVDWHNVLIQLPESFNKNDYEGEKEIIEYINNKQLRE